MGLSISWVAAEGVNRSAMLGALGLADVGRPARGHPVPPPAKPAAFELGGWVFVISPDRRFASRERVSAVSQGAPGPFWQTPRVTGTTNSPPIAG